MAIRVNIDVLLARRGMSVGAFAEQVGITPANIAVLKNGRAKAIRFTTLDAICRTLGCQPGDVLEYVPDEDEGEGEARAGDAGVGGEVERPLLPLLRPAQAQLAQTG